MVGYLNYLASLPLDDRFICYPGPTFFLQLSLWNFVRLQIHFQSSHGYLLVLYHKEP